MLFRSVVHRDGARRHVEMKKLRHRLVLTVEGPDPVRIERGLARLAPLGAVASANDVDGLALPAAATAILARLLDQLGEAYVARIDDQFHWVYWDA